MAGDGAGGAAVTAERRQAGGRRELAVAGPDGVSWTGTAVEHPLGWRLDAVDPPPDSWLDELVGWAAEEGALGLRAAAGPDAPAWAARGFEPLAPGTPELVRPIPQTLDAVDRTRALGARLAAVLRPGDLVVLSGPLGAGKTALTQGLASALGVRSTVTSPTFVLARAHRGRIPLVHVDAYRLRSAGGPVHLDDLDLDAALEDAVTVVEWGEGLVEHLAESWLDVLLDRRPGDPADRRVVTVRPHGPRWSTS